MNKILELTNIEKNIVNGGRDVCVYYKDSTKISAREIFNLREVSPHEACTACEVSAPARGIVDVVIDAAVWTSVLIGALVISPDSIHLTGGPIDILPAK